MDIVSRFLDAEPRPGLQPIPGTTPLTLEAMICPPLLYYLALLFLPPAPPPAIDTLAVKALRSILALLAAILFFRLPLAFHVPQSIGLTYQLGLVGLYGGARVVDAFFISPYLFGHIPRRVRYKHESRVATPLLEGLGGMKANAFQTSSLSRSSTSEKVVDTDHHHPPPPTLPLPADDNETTNRSSTSATDQLDNISIPSLPQSYLRLPRHLITGPRRRAVLEHTVPDDGWPHMLSDRAAWALELELSMRGVGFTWSTADVRHTRKTWLPTVHNRLHSMLVHDLPTLGLCFAVIRGMYMHYDLGGLTPPGNGGYNDAAAVVNDAPALGGTEWGPKTASSCEELFDTRLPFSAQIVLTGCLGAFLMAAFAFAHSAGAVLLSPLAPHPLAFFPPLYTVRIWEVSSVRGFWSYGWHRLFARFFLVYGVWPGEWAERMIMGKGKDERADVGKVLGGFASSAFCHSFAVRGVLGGDWWLARGEAVFFLVNGLAVVLEEGVRWAVVRWRRRKGGEDVDRWWDGWVGRVWWICVLLVSGRSFARGWTNAGLVREISGL